MEKTTEQLKAMAFDLIVARQNLDMQLNQVNTEIAKRMNEEETATPKTKK